ncbi:MAG: hypothetical protein IPK59_02630 [Rhodospirillaceae bacterium]|nr:hypothetical protein [Rhodospirillaceae bacterium]
MADDENLPETPPALDRSPMTPAEIDLRRAELDLRRYEASLSFKKIIWGTVVVGLASVFIPAVISGLQILADKRAKDLAQAQAARDAHQQYIKEFFTTAVNQDIELRIRFATYFSHLAADEKQQDMWEQYLATLTTQKDVVQEKIRKLDVKFLPLQALSKNKKDMDANTAQLFHELTRESTWLNAQIGYAPIYQNVNAPPPTDKERLYTETTIIVEKLARQVAPFAAESADMMRFWELYRKELIGIESRDFSRKMVEIGREIDKLMGLAGADKSRLLSLSSELSRLAAQETRVE